MGPEEWIARRLASLRDAGRYRAPATGEEEELPANGRRWVDARSNDYLGLAAAGVPRDCAGEVLGAEPARNAAGGDVRIRPNVAGVVVQLGAVSRETRLSDGGWAGETLASDGAGSRQADGGDARDGRLRAVATRPSAGAVSRETANATEPRLSPDDNALAAASSGDAGVPGHRVLSAAPTELRVGAVSRETTAELGGAQRPPSQGVSRETSSALRLGAGAARLISGTAREHVALERELASWLGTEAALLFSSAYAANLGVVSALALPGDVVYSDALNHASIIDGCRLSRAEVVVVPHRDLGALAAALEQRAGAPGARWVVTESYFGMDGTSPDFHGLRTLCDAHDAGLLVDEAHSLGVFGPQGRGLAAAAGIRPDVVVGGFGKAFGLQGGFAASTLGVHQWLWNRARSFVFSTGTSPWFCERTRQHLQLVREAESLRARLLAHSARLSERLLTGGVPLPEGRHGPVFPIVFGSERAALEAAAALRPLGVLGQAIRPPTVPPGTARIRVTLRADMADADVEQIAAALLQVWDATQTAARASEGALVDSITSTAEHSAPHHQPAAPASTPNEQQRRWVVLGTGTGVGKSHVADALVRTIAARGTAVAGLKPIETGCRTSPDGAPVEGDAARLEAASFHVKHPRPHPLYAFPDPVAPSLAARRGGQNITLEAVSSWLDRVRSRSGEPASLVIETAGGVLSPLSETLTNFELARCLGAAEWVLVAPDRLGVLHEVASTLRAMQTLGRSPDWLVLNAPPHADPSTGTNGAELRRLGVVVPIVEVRWNETSSLASIVTHPLSEASAVHAP